MIYLDNGATSWPKPCAMPSAVSKFITDFGANPGRSAYKYALKSSEMLYQTRKNLANFFGAENEENVIFSLNSTHLLNIAIKGIIKPNSRVLISDMEHNAVIRPLAKLKEEIGIEIFTFETDLLNNENTIKNFEDAIKNNIDVVISIHASNVTGRILPIYEMGRICREYKCIFIVDACQSAGNTKINMGKCNIDVLCFSPHKGLLSLMGTGVMIINNEKLKIDTLIEGGTGGSSMEEKMPPFFPDRLEAGTLNLPGILSINIGLDYIKSQTPEKIGLYENALCRRVYNAFLNFPEDIILYTPYPEKDYVGVLSFNIKDKSPSEISSFLDKRNICVRSGLHCCPSAHKKLNTLPQGTVRVSFGPFNTIKDADMLICSIRDLILNQK